MGMDKNFNSLFDGHFSESDQKRIKKELMMELNGMKKIRRKEIELNKPKNQLQNFSYFIKNNTLILFLNNSNKNIISIPLFEFYNISAEKDILYIKTSNHDLGFKCSTDTEEILNTIHNAIHSTLQSSTKRF